MIAVLAAEVAPDLRMVLVESDQRKATFLAQAVRTLSLTAEVRRDRIEALDPMDADVLSARALAPLDGLCAHAARHLAATGTALFQKGAQVDVEIAEALRNWTFSLTRHGSRTDPGATILALRDIAHV